MPADSNATDPFFIVGTGRCGSTLLQAILARHPQVAIPPETQFFDHLDFERHDLPDPLPVELVPRYLESVRARGGDRFLATDPDVWPDFEQRLAQGPTRARDLFLWLLDRMTREQTGTRLGEKTPQHWQRLDRITSLFPNCHVIHIHRDPRDVVPSLLRMDWWGASSVWRTARYWAQTLDAASAWQRRLGPRHLTVRFESLLDNPEREMTRVCAFLDVPFVPESLEPGDEPAPFVPSEAAYKKRAEKPIDPTRSSRARESLTPAQLRTIEARVGGRRMRRFGYEPGTGLAPRLLTRAAIELGRPLGR